MAHTVLSMSSGLRAAASVRAPTRDTLCVDWWLEVGGGNDEWRSYVLRVRLVRRDAGEFALRSPYPYFL